MQTRNAVVAKDARRADVVEAAVAMVLAEASILMPHDEAEDSLIEALRHGDVAAKGKRGTMRRAPDGAVLEAISEADWSSLQFGYAGNRRIARSEPGSASFEIWHDLLFEARSLIAWLPEPRAFLGLAEALAERMPSQSLLIEHLPEPDESPSPVMSARPASMADARAAFEQIVAEWLDAEGRIPRPTRKEVCARIARDLPGMTENRVRALWGEMAPHEWRVKGPRRSLNSADE